MKDTVDNSVFLETTAQMTSFEQKLVDLARSTAQWTGKKLGGSHTGTIQLSSGKLKFKEEKLEGGTFVIDMASITVTDLSGGLKEKLEEHLKSDDFFSSTNFPLATLQFASVKHLDGVDRVDADLTVKGITNPISFDFVYNALGATVQLTVDRSAYNVRYGSKSFFKGLGDNFIHDNFEVEVTLYF